jgi:hypothetical protein
MDGKTIFTDLSSSRPPGQRVSAGGRTAMPDKQRAEISALLGRLRSRTCRSAGLEEVLRLRKLMAAVAGPTPDSSPRGNAAQALGILDAALDSPLDLDASLFETIQSTLEPAPPSGTAELAQQMRRMNRLMQRQAQQAKPGRSAAPSRQAKRQPAGAPCSRSAVSVAVGPASSTRCVVRGFHVRQAGHDFVLPVGIIESAFAADVDKLPTVQGRAVARFCGEMCNVIRLAGYLGLMARGDSSPKTLIVIAESGTRACLAVDQVVGPVETAVTSMESVLPKVTGISGVALLKSGGLALVPDLSRLLSSR